MTNQISPLVFEVVPNANPYPEKDRLKALEAPGFGTVFSDHMAIVRWSSDAGWHAAKIKAREPFTLDPACSVLHYGQEIFEGMKAYRSADGRPLLFRPQENAKRFNSSARRLAMPELPEADFVAAVEKLVAIDAKWIPDGDGSLYIRPFMFASEVFLGVRPAKEYIFCVITSPVGPYFKSGERAVSIWVSEQYTRAAPGGTGDVKCGGNYASGLAAQAEAASNGCAQVIYLDATERRWVEELGGMNVFFVMEDGSLVTPSLGTILPGITRDAVIQLAKDAGVTVHERPYSFEELKTDTASGKLKEVFACGTAAVVAGIGTVKFHGGELQITGGQTGPTTRMFRERLVGIQRGASSDPHGWVHETKAT